MIDTINENSNCQTPNRIGQIWTNGVTYEIIVSQFDPSKLPLPNKKTEWKTWIIFSMEYDFMFNILPEEALQILELRNSKKCRNSASYWANWYRIQ